MASQKQIAANRLNAQNSTGPRSVEGKARSSMNALKTGIGAKSQLIRGETWTALEELIGEYYGRFHPTAPDQPLEAGEFVGVFGEDAGESGAGSSAASAPSRHKSTSGAVSIPPSATTQRPPTTPPPSGRGSSRS
jgi:hypothetical protein